MKKPEAHHLDFQRRVRERIAAGLPEDDEGDDFQPWVWKILFEELDRVRPEAAAR